MAMSKGCDAPTTPRSPPGLSGPGQNAESPEARRIPCRPNATPAMSVAPAGERTRMRMRPLTRKDYASLRTGWMEGIRRCTRFRQLVEEAGKFTVLEMFAWSQPISREAKCDPRWGPLIPMDIIFGDDFSPGGKGTLLRHLGCGRPRFGHHWEALSPVDAVARMAQTVSRKDQPDP